MPGCCHILLFYTNDNDASLIAPQKVNDLYFVAGSAPGSSRSRVSRLATKPQLLSELWYQRLGNPGHTQLCMLAKHSTGLLSQLKSGLHPMHSCQSCNGGDIRRAPTGPASNTAPLLPCTRFHLDFGFIRASSSEFGVSTGNHIVTSYDGNNTYFLIVCAKARCTWVFCQASKSPTIFFIERFLALNSLKSGPRFLHMDQGGKLWRSNQLGEVATVAGYTMEPTGSDGASKNGKVDRSNGTFGVMVRCLLYIVDLSELFWTATPHEAWTGENPPLSHLLTFGALVAAHEPERRPAKADRHTAREVLLGYGATTKHVRYFDQMMNREKLSTHHTIDEAHYGKTHRPPGP
jgi:hypothetical protein